MSDSLKQIAEIFHKLSDEGKDELLSVAECLLAEENASDAEALAIEEAEEPEDEA